MANPEVLIQTEDKQTQPTQGKSFENTVLFLTEVSVTPIDLRKQTPPRKNQTQDQWMRSLTMVGQYFGTDKTLKEIGGDRQITREDVRQIVKRVVIRLHQNASPPIQQLYPLESLAFNKDKPHTLKSRQRLSTISGGASLKVAEAVAQGKSPAEIKQILGRNPASERKILKNWGIEVPYERPMWRKKLAKLADPELSPSDVQKLLDTVTVSAYLVLSTGDNPLLTSIAGIAKKAGLFPGPKKIALISLVLKSRGVPTGSALLYTYKNKSGEQREVKSHFMSAPDNEKAVRILQSTNQLQHLKENPVTVLGKPTGKTPTVYQLYFSGKFERLSNLIAEVRRKPLSPRGQVRPADIFETNSPASVYVYTCGRSRINNFFYQLDQKEELRAYLAKRLKDLGLL